MSTENATSAPIHTLWAFGSNGSGQLGIGHREDVSTPEECKVDSKLSTSEVRQIAAGGNHTIAIFHDGTLASAGDNSDGRCLASRETHNFTTWQQQSRPDLDLTSYDQIAATWSTTILCYKEGTLGAAGTGNSGELGIGLDITVTDATALTQHFPRLGDPIIKIASCMGHVVVVLASGAVWGWGKGRKGQLGEPAENVWQPRKIEGIPFKVVDSVCGKDFTCLFGDSSSGEIMILGLAGNDRFGVRKNAPENVRGWKQVAASWGSIYVLMESGELLSWGRDDHGQLSPPGLPPLSAVAAGSEHCLGLTKDGKVLAWGWGEHGNCGAHIDDKGDVKGRFNTIAMSQPATAIFAGCATSFIVTSERFDPTETPS